MIKQGRLRGEKVLYPDGIGYCVWYPMSELLEKDESDADDDSGLAFDFDGGDIDDFIVLLQRLRVAEAEVYEEEA